MTVKAAVACGAFVLSIIGMVFSIVALVLAIPHVIDNNSLSVGFNIALAVLGLCVSIISLVFASIDKSTKTILKEEGAI